MLNRDKQPEAVPLAWHLHSETQLLATQAHIVSLETSDENRAALLMGLDYLLKISFVEDDEVFKICLDYWNFFVPDVYSRCERCYLAP